MVSSFGQNDHKELNGQKDGGKKIRAFLHHEYAGFGRERINVNSFFLMSTLHLTRSKFI
jgi:hypothetical protein